ncbi:MAG: translation initiation factor IF-2 [Candidatus Nealsonbacteria bacterium RIFOXYB1_FULL_40_15]|uniref:Translation initiation factor IF-2 n=2 Tax=Candidatus Nealsoniibacteriota TaxID=1817911 RepID=A0A1G2ETH3_9BACT|nr:MAG: translation initiation factor IF-2 [Candidatus Nealsonbacteria bacterium RIFOXYB1_FULL_40_15]OGZ28343.1 MAG: translation initiation factor IF-2 [Candidatus Nealsonbacteria bacterium RIFOXYD1_FULL_39_11]OGZ29145.1 MAG: translation initiation factor IF-2 [Candidatus Nealsonbacteria bacterium RIFOXYC1_FULL_40_7]
MAENNKKTRPPIVVILGHVDHGKSSLLEAIKDFRITAKESGGITQHIGAYQADYEGKTITFLDTPGHEAFEAIRSRGSDIADIAILVIASEEGIKPQTKEAIKLIKESQTPAIVVLNKIDKPSADPERIKRELLKYDIVVESMGGKIPSVNTSASTKQGVKELLEMIILLSELEGFKADYSRGAEGYVIESYIDSKKGPAATLIVKEGILKEGDIVGTETSNGKIKSLNDFKGNPIKEASPSTPVLALGLEKSLKSGEKFKVFKDIASAKKEIKETAGLFGDFIKKENSLNLIIKGDVLGSLEAIEKEFQKIPQEKVSINVVKADTGNISESDVRMAKNTSSIILGFKVKVENTAQKLSLREKIRILNFDIIYELSEQAKRALEKNLEPEIARISTGKIRILAVFKTEKGKQIVGGRVLEGEIKRGKAEVIRNEEYIGEGRITKLQQNKQDTDKISKGRECGISYEGEAKIQENDILNAFVEEKQMPEL